MSEEKLTPLMTQYFNIRSQYPDSILLFQVGDFYEMFFDDAIVASAFLAIALTKRGKCKGSDIPLCGIPVHALSHYLTKLVKGGFKVALCDQLSEPIPGQVVERGVTQVFTPGTLSDPQMLDDKNPSYILSVFPYQQRMGIIFGELLTAQLFATSIPQDFAKTLESELCRFLPDEIILPKIKESNSLQSYFRGLGYWVSMTDYPGFLDDKDSGMDFSQGEATSRAWIETQFNQTICSRVFAQPHLAHTLQLFYFYLSHAQKQSLSQFKTIQFYEPEDYLILDLATQKNLEILSGLQTGSKTNTLFSIVDRAKTSMGSRTIKKWLLRPLVQKKSILQRQEVVASFVSSIQTMQELESTLPDLPDVERIVGRISLKKAYLADYLGLKNALEIVPSIKAILCPFLSLDLIKIIFDKFLDFSPLLRLLSLSLNDNPEQKLIIKEGFDSNLDRARNLINNTHRAILELEQKEIARTGINSLKIRYNSITGYSIEITKTNLANVPADYIRGQTLSNKERYVTKELIDLEREITKAQNEISSLENNIYEQIKSEVDKWLSDLRQLSQALSYLDALYGFAKCAYDNNYVTPSFNDLGAIKIEEGRHPVVEGKGGAYFVPNPTFLTAQEPLWIITGPNMGGKSTYLRQVALICILAQCGSLVPAKAASITILDRIFTRIGSGDNLAEGKSTFLVEMEETAIICRQATKNSLVILDEVGRGTSTYDGLSIAQAVVEYIYLNIGAKCLFATHYHELTKLHDKHAGISNYHMTSKKTERGILFLHKIEKGVSLGSFGLEVAKLAALPHQIIERAREVLTSLESEETNRSIIPAVSLELSSDLLAMKLKKYELDLKNYEKFKSVIDSIDLENLSPKKAFDLIWEIKNLAC